MKYSEKKKDDIALTLACMAGSDTGNYGDNLVKTAKIYKELNGKHKNKGLKKKGAI